MKSKVVKKVKNTKEKTDFQYFDINAKKISVCGTFNEWNAKKNPLKKDKKGLWKTSLALSSGRYEYRFYVDGLWQSSQEPVECVPNAFGTWNCVVTIN